MDNSVYNVICSQLDTGYGNCSETCVGLIECTTECPCAIYPAEGSPEYGGPWGNVMDALLCLLPIIFLVYATLKAKPIPTTLSLPIAAMILWWIRLAYLRLDVIQTCAAVILGFHEALTPISITAGAITLFETMEATLCLPYMMRELKALTTGHPVAELMLIFCFATLIEGASGFGTPVALAAPMLVSTGNPAFESIVTLLLFNAFVTCWGAVGTPIWFGFGSLDLSEEDLVEISTKAGVALGISAFLLIPLTLTVIVPFRLVRQNILFIFLSLCSSVGCIMGIAVVDYQFPTLIGGLVGCMCTSVLIKLKVGLVPIDNTELESTFGRSIDDIGSVGENSNTLVKSYNEKLASIRSSVTSETAKYAKEEQVPTDSNMVNGNDNDDVKENVHAGKDVEDSDTHNKIDEGNENNLNSILSLKETIDDVLGPRKSFSEGYVQELLWRTFPIWATVLMLIVSRVEAIGLRKYLQLQSPYFEIDFGTYGVFRLSVSIVFQLLNILTYPNMNWRYEFLFVPFFIPFVLMSLITMIIFRKDMKGKVTGMDVAKIVLSRLGNPFIALLGALALVQLMIRVGSGAPASLLGNALADWFKGGFVVICPLLGALGSFFSGSTTVSNLTFGSIQELAAINIGTSRTTMLALQCVGASAGNGICLNNIISACAVVGLQVSEGTILARTAKVVFSFTTLATIVMLAFFFRFN
jgi:L-lactate permease